MEAASAFYDALAPLFDVMTDWEQRLAGEGPFLRAVLAEVEARRVLDAACGSGGHALWLAEQGYSVAGADLSPVMIALAGDKTQAAGQSALFTVGGLAEVAGLPALAGHLPFDAALILGNSLPHLLTQAELVAALRGVAATLRPGGLFVTQNLNYDLRWRTRPRWFAVQGGQLAGEEVLVWRFADYDDASQRIAFHIATFRRAVGWRVDVHTTPQRPLFAADLLAALAEAGFVNCRCYGRMAWPAEPFDSERSGDLVVTAVRPTSLPSAAR
jgi:SAM-dependent methyltransferase